MRFGPAVKLILSLVLFPAAACANDVQAVLLDSYSWQDDQPWFGGISGIELDDSGRELTAITDRGRILFARLHRDADRITDIQLLGSTRMRAQSGAPLIGHTVDAEGIAIGPGGALFVSFERVHRVVRYDPRTGAAFGLSRPQMLLKLPFNAGLEALAVDSEGRLYAFPEKAFDDRGKIPVFRWDRGNWSQPFSLPGQANFLPVGADFGPDGRLYLLERDMNVMGFQSRVRSWSINDTGAQDERLVLETRRADHDNLEGLTVWRDTAGRIRLTMVSDDNFLFFMKSELAEYVLPNPLAHLNANR